MALNLPCAQQDAITKNINNQFSTSKYRINMIKYMLYL
ncbi:MAG: hypothetical protein Faunusvirus66_4 [Faunusvirus sp.]|uniref:Uncharacterized protein n=1 Tax=Faunusvirus sp. TaxID=2487766 RepID=A0A3G4ZY69_9VIRU|nr:MAG: hypothetical protein Faunusvirus66_4 [Faunusvirus sp.]